MARFSIDLKNGNLAGQTNDIILGIDLGTTNSLVAYVKDGNSVAVKASNNQKSLIPSIVHFSEDGSIIVGEAAHKKLETDSKNTVYSVKRLMGKSFSDIAKHQHYFGYEVIDDGSDNLVKVKVREKFYSPIELSSEILKELKRMVENELGATVSKAVITVPAYFNDSQRQATRDAGKLAGLDVLRIINEPTAASLAYGLGKKDAEIIAVYDLGGGTFDISLLQIQDGVFEVLATNGDTFLGGDDFDRAIISHWMSKLGTDYRLDSQSLRLMAEQCKKNLSSDDFFQTELEGQSFELTRQEFEALIKPLVVKSINCCANALKDAGIGIEAVDKVVMVGGSTRIPFVKKTVGDFFQKTVFDGLDPDEVVALGAAIQADVLAGNQKDVLLLDITPLSLGIETVGGLMDTIIPRNSKVPTKAGRQYTTSVDGQKNLKIAVYQGERDLVADNRKLGEFILRNIPPMPAGLPKIEVQFIIDADGILKVRAKELRSGLEQAIEIKPTYGISEEEMAKMLLASISNAQIDMQNRAVIEAKNEANHILLSADKFLKQHAQILSQEEFEKTTALVDSLRSSFNSNNKDSINNAIHALNEFTAPLAQKAMDVVVREAMKGKKV